MCALLLAATVSTGAAESALSAPDASATGVSASASSDIIELLEQTGALLEWDEFTRTGVLWSGLDSISFAAGESIAVANFDELLRVEPIIYDRGRLRVPRETFSVLADRLGRRADPVRLRPVKAIVIDPGHGGRDPGTFRSLTIDGETITYYEKDIVLEMGTYLKAELSKLLDGPEIHLTRESDVYLPLKERTEFAHALRDDPLDNVLFVSLHVNASPLPWTDARGVEIYYLPATQRRQVLEEEIAATLEPEVSSILNDLKEEEYTVESVLMGKAVLDAIARDLPDTPIERGVRVANFFVVREARMPSILIETGFINNRQDLELLATSEYRRELAAAIASGIAAYVRDFEQLQ